MAAFLRHHNIVLGLALRGGIHGSKSYQIIFLGVELYWWLLYLGWDSGKFRFALRVRVNAHIELVRAKRSISQMDINPGRVDRLAVRIRDGEFYGAWAGSSVGYRDIVGLR